MTDQPAADPRHVDASMKGPWTASFLLHAGVFALVNVFAWQNAASVQRQVEATAERFEQEQQREADRLREEELAAAAAAARERLKMEVADLVTVDGASPEATAVLASVGASLDDLFADGSAAEMDAGEWEQLRMEAIGQAQADADRLLREELVAQARAHVRDTVAPELRDRIERELRDRAGSELEKAVDEGVRDDQAKRLKEAAGELRKQAEELGKAKRELEEGAALAERGEQPQAAGKAGSAQDQLAKGEAPLKQALERAAANDPASAGKAAAAADGTAAREAVAKAAGGDKDAAKRAASEVGKRQAAVEKLAGELESRAGRKDAMDANERALAKEARDVIDDELRERVAKRVAEKAVPEAAAKVADAIGAELARAGIERAPFEQLLREDITKALGEEMKDTAAEAALERTDRRAGLDTPAELAQAQAAASGAAEKLARLAAEQDRIRSDKGDRAEPEAKLASEARDAERQARDAVAQARRAGLRSDAELDQATQPLRDHAGSDAARRAEKAERSGDKPKADEAMQQSADALRDASARMAKAAEAIGKEREALAEAMAKAAKGPHGMDGAGVGPSAEAVAAVAAKASGAMGAVDAGIDKAAGDTGTGGTALDAAKLARLQALKEALAQAAKNASEGRALGNPALFGAPGAGSGPMAGTGSAKRAKMASYNRAAYEAFVKDLRERTNPTNAYAAPQAVDGLDSIAEAERGPFPAAVWAPEPTPAKPAAAGATDSAAKREVPTPTFKHVAFGAAAMVTAPITIDGDLADWGELTHPLELRWRAHDTAPSDGGPKLHVRWSNEGLFLAYSVVDPTGIQPNREHAYSGDCLELWLDLENSRRDQMRKSQYTHQFCFDPFGFNGDAKTTFVEVGRDHRGLKMFQQYADPTGTRGRSAAREVPGGYVVEAFVSRQALARPVLVPGAYVALNASVNVGYDEAAQRQWSAPKAIQTWDKPDTWGDVLLLGSDAVISALDSDGTKTSRVVPGQVLQVEVADPDMDLDGARADRVMASAVGEGGEPVLMVLRETGPGTGVFRGSVNTQLYLDEPRRNTLAVRPGDRVTIAYDDPRAAYGEQDRRVTAELPVATPVIRLATVTP